MQHRAPPTVCKAIALQLQRKIFIDTSFVNTYTTDLLMEHNHSDRLMNFSRYMSSIHVILFVAELLLITQNAVGKLNVKSLQQDTINITFISPHAHLRSFFFLKGGGYGKCGGKMYIIASIYGLQSALPRSRERIVHVMRSY